MASELPYLPTYKNVDKLFQKIASAKQPEAFTQRYLSGVIGLTSVGDRSLITLLKTLGFLDAAGRPTAEYAALKNPLQARRAIAGGIRNAYEPLFAANENAHRLPPDELKGLVAQVAGSDTGTTSKIVGTLNALLRQADFSQAAPPAADQGEASADEDGHKEQTGQGHSHKTIRPDFHYNIQVHLPANATEDTYINIFNALRRAFK